MRLLLDTHVALWAIADDPRLSARARDMVDDPANDVIISAASVWEIGIKHRLARRGLGRMPISGKDALRYFVAAGYDLLAISPAHAVTAADLPPLHTDPFDRMLVAQSLAEPLRLVTHDAQVAAYGDTILRV